jgi:hypothetical protein
VAARRAGCGFRSPGCETRGATDDPGGQAAVEDRWFYPPFTANLDKVAPGFAQFLRDAIAVR